MSDVSEKRPLTKCVGLYLLKQGRSHRLIHVMDLFKVVKKYRTIEHMCSDAHSITLRGREHNFKTDLLYIRGENKT